MKIISFSLWGNSPKYCIGALKNAELAKVLYPDLKCWFYVPCLEDCKGNLLIDTIIKLSVMDNCKVIQTGAFGDWRGMFWRFDAISDPLCEVMISRDCDSRLSLRERLAVDEWLTSPRTFHIMRDHPWHGSKMLGGVWCVKGPFPMIRSLAIQWPAEDRYQTDQDFLNTALYPIASRDVMIHAQFCAIEDFAIPFPKPRTA